MKDKSKYKHYEQGGDYKATLVIDLTKMNEMRCQLHGDPVIVAKMIAKAMDEKQDIAAAFVAGVVYWMDSNDIPRHTIGELIKFN